MANDLNQNPLVVDTAADLLTRAPIMGIVWSGATSAHTLVIHDGETADAKVLFSATFGAGGPVIVMFPLPLAVKTSIRVSTIGGGLALIYLGTT